jgi:guanylate kinase
MDAQLYVPSPVALQRLKQVRFVAVVGPTAVGKTTLIREAMKREPSLHLVLNNTSRARRPDEQEGVDYRFETQGAMEARIAHGEYAQVAPTVFGDLYATAADDYATDGVAVMPVLADALPQFEALPFAELRVVYVLPPDWEIWQTRVAKHGFTPEKLAGRMQEAKRSLQYARDHADMVFVVSRDVAQATDDFVCAVFGRPYPAAMQADQILAPTIINDALQRLAAV